MKILEKFFKKTQKQNRQAPDGFVKKGKKMIKPYTPPKMREGKKSKKIKKNMSGNEKEHEVYAYDVLIKPIFSEKTAKLSEDNVYCFEVDKRANKQQIKKSVKQIYKVDAIDVRVSKIAKKPKRIRVPNRYNEFTKTGGGRKAFIKLKKGDKISLN